MYGDLDESAVSKCWTYNALSAHLYTFCIYDSYATRDLHFGLGGAKPTLQLVTKLSSSEAIGCSTQRWGSDHAHRLTTEAIGSASFIARESLQHELVTICYSQEFSFIPWQSSQKDIMIH